MILFEALKFINNIKDLIFFGKIIYIWADNLHCPMDMMPSYHRLLRLELHQINQEL